MCILVLYDVAFLQDRLHKKVMEESYIIVAQLLNKFAACYGTRRYVTWVGGPQTSTTFWF